MLGRLSKQNKKLLKPYDMNSPSWSGHIFSIRHSLVKRQIHKFTSREGHFRATSRIDSYPATLVGGQRPPAWRKPSPCIALSESRL